MAVSAVSFGIMVMRACTLARRVESSWGTNIENTGYATAADPHSVIGDRLIGQIWQSGKGSSRTAMIQRDSDGWIQRDS